LAGNFGTKSMDNEKPIDSLEGKTVGGDAESEDDVFEIVEEQGGRSTEAVFEISNDGLRATVQVFPPVGDGDHITLEMIQQALADKKISHGIDEEAVEKIVVERIYMKSVQIAKGTPAVDGHDAQLFFHYSKNREVQDRSLDNLERINLKEHDNIINVNADLLLIEKTPATKGEPGKIVTGKSIPQLRGKDIRLRAGKGVKADETGLLFHSTMPGQVIFRNNQIRIEDVYEVEDVDASTGNIHFKGSVIISGLVNDGYLVESDSEIRITGTVGDAQIHADGDIIIAGGVFGSGECEIVSKNGSIFAKFAHNAKFSAAENIIIEDYTKECDLTAGKVIKFTSDTPNRGFMQGGRAVAAEEFFAQAIGSEIETKTFVGVGVDSGTTTAIAKDEIWIADMQKKFGEALKNIHFLQSLRERDKLDDGKQKLLDKLIVGFSKIRNAIEPRVQEYHQTIRKTIGVSKGKITAMQSVHPGVKLKVGGETIIISKIVQAVTYVPGSEGIITRAVRTDDGSEDNGPKAAKKRVS
jgi:uncharacterized protein